MKPETSNPLILNVDDTEAARYAKTRVLTRAGFRVVEAACGNEALIYAQRHKPNLILLDIKLPDINGFEVCRRLKASPDTHTILVLQTSASFIASADKVRALEGGADNYLFEPIEPEELIANVKALVRLGQVERELREADRRKDIFLATLAHELRNPLAPILTAVELLRLLEPKVPEMQERARETIFRQTNHLIRLVDDLLDVSRITNGKIVLKTERVELRALLNAAAEAAESVMKQKNHVFTVELPETEMWLNGDSVRLMQIVGNLLNNAAKFTSCGGNVVLSAEQAGDHVSIRVADNGIGLSPCNAAAIFDLFVQAGHVLESAKDGLGIGLSLAKGLVELHGGTIRAVSSGEGHGSLFDVCLPIGAAQSDGDREQPVAEPTPECRRILVVDDNVDGADLICALLEQQGHVLEKCHSGADALAKAAVFQPEIVILDIGLPDMSGFDVARQLRQRENGETMKLIALTGYGRQDDKDNASKAGFDFHLTKPVSIVELSSTIAHVQQNAQI